MESDLSGVYVAVLHECNGRLRFGVFFDMGVAGFGDG